MRAGQEGGGTEGRPDSPAGIGVRGTRSEVQMMMKINPLLCCCQNFPNADATATTATCPRCCYCRWSTAAAGLAYSLLPPASATSVVYWSTTAIGPLLLPPPHPAGPCCYCH